MLTKIAPEQRDNILSLIALRKTFFKERAAEAKTVGEDVLERIHRGSIDQLKMIEDMLKAKFEVFLSEDDWMLLGK